VATLVGAAIVAVLGVLFDAMSKALTLPVWGYLSILTLILVIAWGVVYLAKQQQRANLANCEDRLAMADDDKRQLEQRLSEYNDDFERMVIDQQDAASNAAARERVLKDRIAELEEGIRLRDEMKLVQGLYYRASDGDFKQPFCRVCWEADDPKARTVMNIYQDHQGNWQYYCDWCEQSYALPDSFGTDEVLGGDEEIPF